MNVIIFNTSHIWNTIILSVAAKAVFFTLFEIATVLVSIRVVQFSLTVQGAITESTFIFGSFFVFKSAYSI